MINPTHIWMLQAEKYNWQQYIISPDQCWHHLQNSTENYSPKINFKHAGFSSSQTKACSKILWTPLPKTPLGRSPLGLADAWGYSQKFQLSFTRQNNKLLGIALQFTNQRLHQFIFICKSQRQTTKLIKINYEYLCFTGNPKKQVIIAVGS